MAFHRRRAKPSPNKNTLKINRAMEAASEVRRRGLLSERCPSIAKLAVSLDFLNQEAQLFDRKTMEFLPGDPCSFVVSCPGRCSVGVFDLSGNIFPAIEARRPEAEFVLSCAQPLPANPATPCGYRLRGRINASYIPVVHGSNQSG